MKRACCAALLLTASTAAAREYGTFDVVGDSISAGVNAGCGERYGWVDMLFGESGCGQPAPADTLTNLWPGITAYNSAISGSTAKDWAWQQPSYMNTVSNHHPDLVVVFIGGNDGLAYAADGAYTEAERNEFCSNLVVVVQKLRCFSPPPEIVLVDYYDLFDGLSASLPDPYGAYRVLSRAAAEGNTIISNTASSNACFFVEIYPSFMHHCYGEAVGDTNHLSPDYVRTPITSFDIHPNTAGHAKIHELVHAMLRELKDMPALASQSSGGAVFLIRWTSGINQTYVVERSTNLITGFDPIATNAATPTLNVFTDSVDNLPAAFYRIRVE